MSLQLYYLNISPPARAVLLAIRNLGLEVDLKVVNLLSQEHLTPEFLKLNPAHQIPVLVDGDFVMSESRAIMTYLVNSRKPGSDLYPLDPKKRALVDQRLYFDATIVFERNCAVVRSVFFEDATTIPQGNIDRIFESMTILDSFVENSLWFAGEHVTLADLTILANVTQIKACGYDISQHEHLSKWLERCKDLPGFDENQKNADELGKFFKSKIPNGF